MTTGSERVSMARFRHVGEWFERHPSLPRVCHGLKRLRFGMVLEVASHESEAASRAATARERAAGVKTRIRSFTPAARSLAVAARQDKPPSRNALAQPERALRDDIRQPVLRVVLRRAEQP